MSVGAILLVGGRSRRMGGGFKPMLEVGGQTLLARAVHALTDAGCNPIVVAGPALDEDAPVLWVREEPPFSGPVAGIAAALGALPAPEPEWILLLAGDLPRAPRLIDRLRERIGNGDDAEAHVFTADEHPQWLAGAYRAAALRQAIGALDGEFENVSCRAALGGLEIRWLNDEAGETADIDTPADLDRIRAEFEEES